MGIRQKFDELGRMQCRLCSLYLPADSRHFVTAPVTKNGLSSRCKECNRTYHRRWKESKGPAYKERCASYYRDKYKPVAEAKRVAREAKYPVRHRAKILRSGMLARSTELGLPFDTGVFTTGYIEAWLRAQPNCPCCSTILRVGVRGSLREKCDQSPSMDRFDPAKGYVVGNVHLLCWRCNNLKRDASIQDLESVVLWMKRTCIGDELGTKLGVIDGSQNNSDRGSADSTPAGLEGAQAHGEGAAGGAPPETDAPEVALDRAAS